MAVLALAVGPVNGRHPFAVALPWPRPRFLPMAIADDISLGFRRLLEWLARWRGGCR